MTIKKVIHENGCEIELGRSNKKIFVKVFWEPLEIWIDFKGLPNSAFLCALCDCESLLQSKCGIRGNLTRNFVNIEWAINEWGGDKEIVEALKKRKQMIIDDLPRLKEKYSREVAK